MVTSQEVDEGWDGAAPEGTTPLADLCTKVRAGFVLGGCFEFSVRIVAFWALFNARSRLTGPIFFPASSKNIATPSNQEPLRMSSKKMLV